MASEPGTIQQSRAPGTLEKFHLGLAADGTTCALLFVENAIARSPASQASPTSTASSSR